MADYRVYDLLVEQSDFSLTSPVSSGRRISFLAQGKLQDPEFTDWAVVSELGTPRLVLTQSGKILCKLVWHDRRWQGRDVRGGVTSVRPIKDPHLWDSLFEKKRETDKKPSLLMRERITGKVAYEQASYNLADRFERDHEAAIAIIGCNRVDYFSKVISAVRSNKLTGYDLYVFIDRPLASAEQRFQKEIAGLSTGFRVVEHPINFGCGRSLIDAREQLFQNMGYERAFIFEDDMVPSSDYIPFCENLLKWGQANYTNIGAVQGWSKCLLPKEQKAQFQRQVFATFTNWWGYLMPKKTWDDIRTYILEYRDLFLNVEYSRRPHRTIMEWLKPKAQANFATFEGGFIPDANSIEHRRKLFGSIPSGQDGATWIAFDSAGYVRLGPTVNRGLYIGARGLHMRPDTFRKDRFDQMTLDVFPDDGRIKKFEPR